MFLGFAEAGGYYKLCSYKKTECIHVPYSQVTEICYLYDLYSRRAEISC